MATAGTADDESSDEYLILTWGANSYGQLGLNHCNDVKTPTVSKFPSNKRITLVIGGGGHSAFLSERALYCCGWSKHNQTGLSIDNYLIPTKVDDINSATTVKCGWNHTLVITDNGCVIAFGSNSHGQLGLSEVQSHTISPLAIPSKLFCEHKVVDIACGLRHSAAISDAGAVFTWGSGRKGQLGHGRSGVSHINQPELVKVLKGKLCTKVCAMAHCTAVCGDDGSLYLFGCNVWGQCAVNSSDDVIGVTPGDIQTSEVGVVTAVHVPIKVKSLPPVEDISCGWSHTIVVTAAGRRVFGWGRCDYGQLGIPLVDATRFVSVPTEVKSLLGVKQVACGSEHNIAIGKDGELLSWGWNDHGMCGTGDTRNVTTPTKISPTLPIDSAHFILLLVGAGAGHSIAVVTRKK